MAGVSRSPSPQILDLLATLPTSFCPIRPGIVAPNASEHRQCTVEVMPGTCALAPHPHPDPTLHHEVSTQLQLSTICGQHLPGADLAMSQLCGHPAPQAPGTSSPRQPESFVRTPFWCWVAPAFWSVAGPWAGFIGRNPALAALAFPGTAQIKLCNGQGICFLPAPGPGPCSVELLVLCSVGSASPGGRAWQVQ